MNCEEAQNLIVPFVRDELSRDTAVLFSKHMIGCKNCKSELEVNYCLLTAIRQLNENSELTSDFIGALNQKLNDTLSMGKHYQQIYLIKKSAILMIIIIIGILIG